MSNEFRAQSATLHDYLLKQTRLVFEVGITHHATPASKVHSTNLPGVVYLRTEGKTAQADAIEDLSASFTTAADSTGIFGILVDDIVVTDILKCTVTPTAGTVAATAAISAEGRVYIDCDSNQSFASTDVTFLVELEVVY